MKPDTSGVISDTKTALVITPAELRAVKAKNTIFAAGIEVLIQRGEVVVAENPRYP